MKKKTAMAENKQNQQEEKELEELTFWDHLEVLRWSLFRILIAVVILFAGFFMAMPYIFDKFVLGPTDGSFFIYQLLNKIGGGLFFSSENFHIDIININVASQFMTHITTSLWFALVFSFPYIIYEIWKFIRPALFPEELKHIRFAFFCGTVMFFIGCALGYTVIFPFTFRFLTEYQISPEINNTINLSSYIGNFVMMILIMGIVFEMPLLMWVLGKLGVVTKGFLRQYRRHAIVILLVAAAFITPSGDPFTLSLVFLPLYLLYELSIKVVPAGDSQ